MALARVRDVAHWCLQVLAACCLVYAVVLFIGRVSDARVLPGSVVCDPAAVDVVFTWVNGSDPTHRRNKQRVLKQRGTVSPEQDSPSRYRDYDTLRYAMRSVWANFAPLRRVYIVIADGEQVPHWLNVSDSRVRVVRHSAIMDAASLPTFNSNAIETNLHVIDGLSECFLYLNDDMIVGRRVTLDTFWDAQHARQRVHLADDWKAPLLDQIESNSWHQAVAASNERLNAVYKTPQQSRNYALHGCYFFHRPTFARMRSLLDSSWRATLSSAFRTSTDNVVSFLYPHVALADFGAVRGPLQLQYAVLDSNPDKNADALHKMVRKQSQCICINDGLGDDSHTADAQRAMADVQAALQALVPRAAPWEKYAAATDSNPHRRSFGASPFALLVTEALLVFPVLATTACVVLCCVANIVCGYSRRDGAPDDAKVM